MNAKHYEDAKYALKDHIRPLLCHGEHDLCKTYDLITTLTYVLIDNFCP